MGKKTEEEQESAVNLISYITQCFCKIGKPPTVQTSELIEKERQKGEKKCFKSE